MVDSGLNICPGRLDICSDTFGLRGFTIFRLVEAGMKLAEMNFHMGTRIFMEAHRASSGAAVPNIKPVPVGSAVFGVCSFLLLCIAIGCYFAGIGHRSCILEN